MQSPLPKPGTRDSRGRYVNYYTLPRSCRWFTSSTSRSAQVLQASASAVRCQPEKSPASTYVQSCRLWIAENSCVHAGPGAAERSEQGEKRDFVFSAAGFALAPLSCYVSFQIGNISQESIHSTYCLPWGTLRLETSFIRISASVRPMQKI